MRTIIYSLSLICLANPAPNQGWVKGVTPQAIPQQNIPPQNQPHQMPSMDTTVLTQKVLQKAPLSQEETAYLTHLQTKYQANPVLFSGKPEEKLLRFWKNNYLNSNEPVAPMSPSIPHEQGHVAQPALADHSGLMRKLEQRAFLTTAELSKLVQLKQKYQANPVGMRGTSEEKLLMTWKKNYPNYATMRISNNASANALWDKITKGAPLTQQDQLLISSLKTQYQTSPLALQGSIEEAIIKTTSGR